MRHDTLVGLVISLYGRVGRPNRVTRELLLRIPVAQLQVKCLQLAEELYDTWGPDGPKDLVAIRHAIENEEVTKLLNLFPSYEKLTSREPSAVKATIFQCGTGGGTRVIRKNFLG